MKKVYLLSFAVLLLTACSKQAGRETAPAFNCDAFKTGIGTEDNNLAGNEVNQLCADLMPVAATAQDAYGQRDNLWILAERLSGKCGIKAAVVCYACIETLPAQSEIALELEYNGTVYHKTIDMITDPDHMLVYNGMHD